jgi:hypothetical protein
VDSATEFLRKTSGLMLLTSQGEDQITLLGWPRSVRQSPATPVLMAVRVVQLPAALIPQIAPREITSSLPQGLGLQSGFHQHARNARGSCVVCLEYGLRLDIGVNAFGIGKHGRGISCGTMLRCFHTTASDFDKPFLCGPRKREFRPVLCLQPTQGTPRIFSGTGPFAPPQKARGSAGDPTE